MTTFQDALPLGKDFVSPARTISEEEFASLNRLTWTTAGVHTDREVARAQGFSDVVAGPWTIACMVALPIFGEFGRAVYQSSEVRPLIILGFEEIRFSKPLLPSDTIRIHSTILSLRPTSKNPRRAIVRIRDTAVNQHDEEILTGIRLVMFELTG